MSVNILGGRFKGHSLNVPSSSTTRPTAVLLRRKLFDRFQDCSQKIFIDLCSGTGPMGFEALSRGAEKVIFVESRREVAQLLRQNLDSLSQKFKQPGIMQQCEIVCSDAASWLEQRLNRHPGDKSEMLFFDPPYEDHQLYESVANLLVKHPYQGDIFFESDVKKGPPKKFWEELSLTLKKSYEHGDHFINWYWPPGRAER